MRKKKKGSTLITVVIIFGVLFTVGTSILALTASDYKLRIGESKRIQNLYGSESGLDIAQAIMRKTVESAIEESNKAVEAFLNNPGGLTDANAIETEKNNIFRDTFEDIINRELKICIEGLKNVNFLTSPKSYEEISFNSDKKPELILSSMSFNEANKTFNVKIQSTFSNLNSGGNEEQKRTIEANYVIIEPQYNGTYYIESNQVQIPQNTVYQKAIAIDGNLTLSGNVDVNGKVFVKGDDASGSNYNTKYEGGILIDGDSASNIHIRDLLVTDKTIKVKRVSSFELTDVYARNFFIENANNITMNTLVLDNDLNITAESGLNLNLQNLYGIGDINKEADTNGDTDRRARVSSSIILNSTNPNINMNVSGDTYLMGTAYIKTDPSYQTGESIAIKGNYKAYTNPLQSSDISNVNDKSRYSSDNVEFGYYAPLQLVDAFKDKSALSALDKSKYFYYYSKSNSSDIKKGGNINVNPEKTVTYGAFIRNNEVYDSTFKSDVWPKITELQNQYATNVYLMGNSAGNQAIYNAQRVVNTVANQINFDNITNTRKENGNDVLVLNNDSSKTVILRGNDYNNFDNEYSDTTKYIIIDVRSAKNGIIITKGDVELVGSFNFTGTIVARGNLQGTKGQNQKTITYDGNVVQRIMVQNYELFNNIVVSENSNSAGASTTIRVDSNLENYIDGSKFIQSKLWKIVK